MTVLTSRSMDHQQNPQQPQQPSIDWSKPAQYLTVGELRVVIRSAVTAGVFLGSIGVAVFAIVITLLLRASI
jgi:hypothetical protein